MRINRFGVRDLKCVPIKGRPTYFWAPVSLQKLGIFKRREAARAAV